MKTRTNENKKRLHSLILLTAFTAVLLIVSTYAWFTAQTDVSISNIRGKVEVSEGLEISLDGARWTSVLDFGAANVSLTRPAGSVGTDGSTTIVYGPVTSSDNVVPAEIKPVSTSGEVQTEGATAKDKRLAMLTSDYADGALKKISLCDETKAQNFYAFDLYVKNTSSTGTADEVLQLNSDSWAWVLPEGTAIVSDGKSYVGNSDSGLQNTIRVAFARYDEGEDGSKKLSTIPTTASKETVQNTAKNHTINAVSIWEPNSKYHVQYILDTVKPMFDLAMESTSHGYLDSDNDQFFTRTLNLASKDKTNVNVYDWRSSNTNLTETKTLQTERASETSPYLDQAYDLTLTQKVTKGTDTEYNKMDIAANAITKFRVYVYIEGQDPDCHNYASSGGGIEVNIGLTKDLLDGDTTKRTEVQAEGTTDPGSFEYDKTNTVPEATPYTPVGG